MYQEIIQHLTFLKHLSHTWQIYLKCRAGGTFNETGDDQQHLQGTIVSYNFFLTNW